MKKISLIIPTYQRETYLIDTLKCAFAQDFDSFEIIVVDQTKVLQPETLIFLENHKDHFQYIQLSEASLTLARNTGIHSSVGEVIVMIDDDTLFKKDFIQKHWEAHQEGYDVVSGRVDEGHPTIARHPVWFNRWARYTGSENCLSDGPTNKLAGCNGSFKRKVFDALEGFDERFVKMANFEDSDFGYRAYKAGFKVWFKASAVLTHRKALQGGVGNRSTSIYLDPCFYQNRFYFTRKNFAWYAYAFLYLKSFFKITKHAWALLCKASKASYF